MLGNRFYTYKYSENHSKIHLKFTESPAFIIGIAVIWYTISREKVKFTNSENSVHALRIAHEFTNWQAVQTYIHLQIHKQGKPVQVLLFCLLGIAPSPLDFSKLHFGESYAFG